MRNKSTFLFIFFLFLVLAGIVYLRFFIGGDEDTWICQDGAWVAHGKPLAPMPTGTCGQTVVAPTSTPTPVIAGNVTLVYQPMQCIKTAWQQWYESEVVNYTNKVPTDTELITRYYSSQEIEVSDVKKVNLDVMTCEACGTCPTTYNYELKVAAKDLEKMTLVGWQQRSEGDSLAPTNEPRIVMETAIKQAFATKYKKKVSEITISIGKNSENHASGTVRFAGEADGGFWYAAKDASKWVLVFDGQGAMFCSAAEKYNFPKEMVAECIDKATGETLTR